MNRYKVAILGGGARGREHAAAFAANADRFEIVAVCDRDRPRREGLVAQVPAARPYGNPAKMLADEHPDVFCFATQPDLRFAMIELGVMHRVAAIAYEKPMATSLAEARRIADLCEKASVKTIVSHQHKYGAHWRKAREIIDAGEIGRVHSIHATSKGWFLHYITHLIDCAMFLIGPTRGQWVVGQASGRGKLDNNHPSPDYVLGQIAFDNGVRGIFECGQPSPDQPTVQSFWHNAGATVYGSEGYVRVIVGYGWQAVTKSSGGKMICGEGGFDVAKDQPLYIRDLADWLDDPAKVHPCNGQISYHGFEMSMGMLLSSLQRRIVPVPVDVPDTPALDQLRQQLPQTDHG